MATTKTKWVSEIPKKAGWYWARFRLKNKMCVRPAQVVFFKKTKGADPTTYRGQDVWVVDIFRYGEFTSLTRTVFGFDKVTFGPKIEVPK